MSRIILGSRKRIWIGGWVLFGIIWLGFNGYTFLTFLDPQLPAQSEWVKLARQKKNLLEKSTFNNWKSIPDSIDMNKAFVQMPQGNSMPVEKKITERTKSKTNRAETVVLPIVSGILEVSNIRGRNKSYAVINGKGISENQRIKGFLVKRITADGVTLTRGGRSWFIPAPEVHFSLGSEG